MEKQQLGQELWQGAERPSKAPKAAPPDKTFPAPQTMPCLCQPPVRIKGEMSWESWGKPNTTHTAWPVPLESKNQSE